jgi:hypothetical protein
MTTSPDTSMGSTTRRHAAARACDADTSSERDVFARAHPVLFGLMGLLIALTLTFAALQALMTLIPGGAPGA